MFRKLLFYTVFMLAVCVLLNSSVVAQENTSDAIKALKAQLEALKKDHADKIKELDTLIRTIMAKIDQKEQEDELQKLLEEATQLTTVEKKEDDTVGKKFYTGVRQQSALNPNLSVSGDFFGGFSTNNDALLKDPGDFSYGNNGFYLREMEVSFVAPLDPFTRGKSFISITEEEIAIEEAYMEWLNLPANMNLKIGLFNIEFGILNRYHDHALPQFDRPKVLTNFFTNANLGGFGGTGNFLLKPILGAAASSLDIAIVNGGTGVTFTNAGDINMLYSANLTNFYDITSNTFFEWRLSGVSGFNDPAEEYLSTVGNVAFNLKWIPAGSAKYMTFDWKTEFLYGRRETPGDPVNSKGFYTSVQNKMNARWWLTGRFDYSELPYDTDQHEWAATIGADFWQSEFVFMRFQYQYTKRDFTSIVNYPGVYPNDGAFIVQVNWAMGPHKHEIY
ncbi:hypothetical protein ACFL67_02690 [candidate division KSB1 bacterium]